MSFETIILYTVLVSLPKATLLRDLLLFTFSCGQDMKILPGQGHDN